LRNVIGLLRIGQQVELQLIRDSRPLTISALIGQSQQQNVDGGRLSPYLRGAQLKNLQQESRRGKQGVVISKLQTNSRAAHNGLREGDVIVSANRQAVHNLKQLKSAVSRSKSLLLNLHRGNQALFLLIQ